MDKILRFGTLHPQKGIYDNTDWKPVYSEYGIVQTLTAAMGMGGGYVPYVVVKNGRVKESR